MTQIIESNYSLIQQAVDSLGQELIYKDSAFFSTVRATARLLDLSPSTLLDSHPNKNGSPSGVLHKLFKCSVDELPESLKPLHGFNYQQCGALQSPNGVMRLLPEVVVMGLIRHYATDARHKRQRAVSLLQAFEAVGLRVFFSEVYKHLKPANTSVYPTEIVMSTEVLEVEQHRTTPVESYHSLLDRLEAMGYSKHEMLMTARANLM